MGEYILKKEVRIDRHIIFLCGPYEDGKDKTKRRAILQEAIYDIFKKKYLPLMIDHFLGEETVNDKEINVQLLEEICAEISHKTYIFLDSISAATELGIFVNSAYLNKIWVFIPKKSDIINKDSIGYFAKNVVLEHNSDKVEIIEYRPSIKRVALSTDNIQEHYGFIDNKIPKWIVEKIRQDKHLYDEDKVEVILKKDFSSPPASFQISYVNEKGNLLVSLSVKFLFYITASIISNEYIELLKKKEENFSEFDIDKITSLVKNSLFNFVYEQDEDVIANKSSVKIKTILKKEERSIILHIAKFIYLYYRYSKFEQLYLFSGDIIKKIDRSPFLFFDFTIEEINLLRDVLHNKEKFYEKQLIKSSGKKREIVKYLDDENGEAIRKLHAKILKIINDNYKYNLNSFAYQKRKNIKECILKHIGGRTFIKYDIKKFFNNIKETLLVKCVMNKLKFDLRYKRELESILNSCFFEDKMPLGLILSPVFSDMFLNSFDSELDEILKHEDMIYTRYADDILISSKNIIDDEILGKIDSTINVLLKKINLEINKKKKLTKKMLRQGDYIKYIGLNLVYDGKENLITIGKRYINDLAKDCLDFNKKVNKFKGTKENNEESLEIKNLFYERLRIIGKIGFIKQIEGNDGILKLQTRLRKYLIDVEEILKDGYLDS